MKKHVVILVLFVCLFLAACESAPLFGPTSTPEPTLTPTPTLTPIPVTGKLEGTVFWSSNNEPISDFNLTLEMENAEKYEFTTGADGKYSSKDLKPGKYSVSIAWEIDKSGKPVSCSGFEIALPKSISIPESVISLMLKNDTGRVLIAIGYEIEIKNGDDITADFQVECK
jgi:hypothetical protein